MKKHRRGQSEGSIFQRSDGRWTAILSLGYQNGKRKRKSFYGPTAAEVRAQLLKARGDKAQGLPVAIERQTVSEFLSRWLIESAMPSVRPRTASRYEELIRIHIAPAIGKIRLEKLTPTDVQSLLNRKLAEGL